MGVLDGQPVNAATTNPAFLDANADDTALGKINLNNISDPTNSGAQIINMQREFNTFSTYTGKSTNVAIGALPAWTNNDVGISTDNLFVRTNAITQKFNNILGHAHDGTAGNGAPISGGAITGVPLRGVFVQAPNIIGATGTSTDVSSDFTGATPSTSPVQTGVVVNAPYNRTVLRYADGPNQGDQIKDGSGNEVYGRLTNSGSTWTLSYYVLISGVETVYSLPTPIDIDWYYQQLYNPMVDTPVYDPSAFTPSDNATADILDASETVAGKVLLANVAPPPVAGASVKGTATRVAKMDHTHEGVHSIEIFGDPTQALDDVQFEAGTLITLSWNSGRLKIDCTASNVQAVEYRTITSGEALAQQLTLGATPAVAANTIVDVAGGGAQFYADDYTVTGNVLSWASLGLGSILDTGDKLRIVYFV